MLPQSLIEPITRNLRDAGDVTPIRGARIVGGGCINQALRLETEREVYFVKWNAQPLPRMFQTEASGLKLLQATGTVRVPAVLVAAEATGDHPAYLLMEWLGGSPGGYVDHATLGTRLALLHQKGTSPRTPPAYGLDHDNYIGSTPQYNGWDANWVRFFGEQRLRPQMELAQRNGRLPSRRQHQLERLIERLESWLGGVERCPSLLHGDLWGGNVLAGPGNVPAIIDPAVYYGDREAELAYTELFGGFNTRFYQAYQETWPLPPGYADRRDLYNLYHLLNHLNLFGESYGSQVDRVLAEFAS
ncbi:MAG: fructosamine kinase family protein [Chloroflexaceae bacterium]|nr:fructosamine kinase family protein [Chloroflexaceae bacterium]